MRIRKCKSRGEANFSRLVRPGYTHRSSILMLMGDIPRQSNEFEFISNFSQYMHEAQVTEHMYKLV